MNNSANYMPPKRLRKLRDALGESQTEFAKRLGVTQATVSRWEDGELLIQGPARILIERLMADHFHD
jgi:DNA-binding transcriptional regulator YiaG